MKKILLLSAIIALCCGCEQPHQPDIETKTPEEEPPLVGTWRATNVYAKFSALVVIPVEQTEAIKNEVEKETSKEINDLKEEDSYLLTFADCGTGSGSGMHSGEYARYDFHFVWKFENDKLIIKETWSETGGILLLFGSVGWTVEEFTADKLVLSFVQLLNAQGTNAGWMEERTYRYTFKKE